MQEGVGNLQPGRWKRQAPETSSDHLGNKAEVLDLGELLWVARMSRSGKDAPGRIEEVIHSGLLVWDIQEQSSLGRRVLMNCLPEGLHPFPPSRQLFCPPGLINPTHRGLGN